MIPLSCLLILPIFPSSIIALPRIVPPPNTLHPLVPLNTSTSQKQPTFDCQRPSRGLDKSCWSTLNLTSYVNDWWEENGDDCDNDFGTCFLSSIDLGVQSCEAINPGACTLPAPGNFTAEQFYVAYNIYAINQFFTSYHQALLNGAVLASSHIAAIIGLINPPLAIHVTLESVLLAISAGFSFILLEKRVLERAIQSMPQVGRCIYPAGSADSRFLQLGQIGEQLGDLINQYQHNISDAVGAIISDKDNFVKFADTGTFSTGVEGLQVQSDYILQGLITFVIAQALKANDMVITRMPGIDPREWQRQADNGTRDLSYNLDCKEYDEYNLCGQWWYDNETSTSYSIDNLHHMNRDYGDTLKTLFGNWTTPQLLIAGADRCHKNITIPSDPPRYNSTSRTVERRDTNGPGSILDINTRGIQVTCLSDVTVCTYDNECMDSDCEFVDCPTQPGWTTNGCPGNADGTFKTMNVPSGYLGPLLWQSSADTIVCR